MPTSRTRGQEELVRSYSSEFRCTWRTPYHLDAQNGYQDQDEDSPLAQVLRSFFGWIETSIATARALDNEDYTPVLVAHGGCTTDFPALLKEVDRSQLLSQQRRRLNLRFVDTVYVFEDLKLNNYYYRFELDHPSNPTIDKIYNAYLHPPYEGYTPLADTRALRRIFSEGRPANKIDLFKKYTHNRLHMDIFDSQIKKFRQAQINCSVAAGMLIKAIRYETMVLCYLRLEVQDFVAFLRNECGIANPKPELLQYLRSKYL